MDFEHRHRSCKLGSQRETPCWAESSKGPVTVGSDHHKSCTNATASYCTAEDGACTRVSGGCGRTGLQPRTQKAAGWSPNYPQKVCWVSSLSPPLKAQQIDLPQNESFSNSNRARSWREARQHVALWSPRVWDGLRGACQRGRNLRMNFMEILQVQTIHWERDRKSRFWVDEENGSMALPSPLSWISEGHENGIWRVQQKVKGGS